MRHVDHELVRQALDGKREAVEQLVRELQPVVHGLSLRMLWQAEDAEDATQEILLRILTRLSRFDGQSSLRTWAYRVATNYLLDQKKRPIERMSFEEFADDLSHGLSNAGPAETERSIAIEDLKLGCSLALLQCLDRGHRLAYILGQILELPSREACEALQASPLPTASGFNGHGPR